jgi:hypothetical protein
MRVHVRREQGRFQQVSGVGRGAGAWIHIAPWSIANICPPDLNLHASARIKTIRVMRFVVFRTELAICGRKVMPLCSCDALPMVISGIICPRIHAVSPSLVVPPNAGAARLPYLRIDTSCWHEETFSRLCVVIHTAAGSVTVMQKISGSPVVVGSNHIVDIAGARVNVAPRLITPVRPAPTGGIRMTRCGPG